MSKKNRQRFRRDNVGVDLHKHETPRERQQRHQRDVGASHQRRVFDVVAWDRMHTEAEDATLFAREVRNVAR